MNKLIERVLKRNLWLGLFFILIFGLVGGVAGYLMASTLDYIVTQIWMKIKEGYNG